MRPCTWDFPLQEIVSRLASRCVTIRFSKVDTVLELRSLTKEFSTHRAVDNVSFSLERGEFFSLLGPSGCGKTTTLRLIAGLDEPTGGDILLNGKSVVAFRPYQRNVNTVFQNYALFPHLTVAQNVAFGLARRKGADRGETNQRVRSALELMQLTGKENRLPNQISGGERQRVALARSLVLEPEVLLLDEPLAALDPKLRKQMRLELKNIQRRVGITFLFITHDEEEALSLSDRMGVMSNGRLEQMGTPQEIYGRPRSRFVAEFLGEVNWVNGGGVRPESTRVSREYPSHLNGDLRAYTGVVEGSTYLGNSVHVRTRLVDGAPCVAEISGGHCDYEPGETVHVWWQASDELHISRTA